MELKEIKVLTNCGTYFLLQFFVLFHFSVKYPNLYKKMPCKKYIPAWHLSIILLFYGHLHGEDFGFAVL